MPLISGKEAGLLIIALLFPCLAISALPIIDITPPWQAPELTGSVAAESSLTGDQLDASGVQNTQDLQYAIPGLVFKSSPGVGDPYLRGVGGTVSASGESGVATLVDSVYLTRTVQSLQALYDIRRIDVTRGPEGVDLGRNVVGGAISIVTQDPGPYHEAYADALYGSSDRRQLRGAVNVPVVDSGLAMRLAGTLSRRDGYSRNIFRDEDLDDLDYYALRAKLRYRPSTSLDMVFSAEHGRQDDTRDQAKQPNPAFGVNGGIQLGGSVPSDPRQVTHNVDQYQKIGNTLYSARLNWRTAALALQSITAYQKTVQHLALDLDATNIDYSANFPASSSRAISQEIRIASNQADSIDWTGGVFFQRENAWQKQDVRFPLAMVVNRPVSNTTNNSYGVFGHLSYRFKPRWRLDAGLRYTYDEGELDLAQTIADPFGVLGPAGTSLVSSRQSDHWQAVTPELNLSYRPDTNTQVYADVSRGYKAGGYNAYAAQTAYAPEYLWSYETGIRTAFPDKKLRINAAIFHYDYRDIQLLTLPPGSPAGTLPIIDNAAGATIQGLDIQARYQPLWNLELSLGATFLDARYRKFISVDPNNPAVDPDRSGDTLQQAPDISLLLGMVYRWVLPAGGDMKLSADYRYQSAVYFNPYQDRAVRQGGYGLLNAHLGFQGRKSNWYAELYAHNLANKLYAQNIVRLDPVVGTVRYWGEPRSYGLRVGYRL